MYAEDMTLFDQMFCVSLVTFILVGAFYLGMAIKEKEIAETQRRRDVESAAHKCAVEGLRGHQRTDITA